MPTKILLSFFLFVAFSITFALNAATSPAIKVFDEITELITRNYINPKKLDLEKFFLGFRDKLETNCGQNSDCSIDLAKKAIHEALLTIGDPHLELKIPGEVTPEVGYFLNGYRFGFKTMRGSTVVIAFVQPETSAEQAGLVVGDQILEVIGETSSNENIEQVIAKHEIKATAMQIRVRTLKGQTKVININPELSTFWKPTWRSLSKNIAYISFPDLRKFNYVDILFHSLINEIESQGYKKIVLDLRFNDGGDGFAAITAAGAFLEKTGRIYTSKDGQTQTFTYEKGKQKLEFSANPSNNQTGEIEKPAFYKGSVVILTSKKTFSAGEDFVDLLQTEGKIRVVGEKTRGGLGTATLGATFQVPNTNWEMVIYGMFYSHLDGKSSFDPIKPDMEIQADSNLISKGHDVILNQAIIELR